MRYLTAFILLASLAAGCGNDDPIARQVVGTWLLAGSTSTTITILTDGSFSSVFLSTNRTVALAYRGTWHVKDSELILMSTDVIGTVPHEPVGSVDRMKINELDSHHMVFTYQAASNYVATNAWVKKP